VPTGGSGGTGKAIDQINITPLADVTIVLIVILLITMPAVLWSGIRVDSTRAARSVAGEPPPNTKTIMVTVEPDGIYLGDRAISPEQLLSFLQEQFALTVENTVIIVPDPMSFYQQVVTVYDVANRGGATRIAVLMKTVPPAGDRHA
jgi:biopolymer transport protein ExbD